MTVPAGPPAGGPGRAGRPRLPLLGRLDPRRWAAAAWALWSAAVLYWRLRRQPLAEIRVPGPLLMVRNRDRGAIRRALLIARVPCLPTALIWQEWHGRLDCAPDVVVGVRRDGGGTVRAHAWLEGEDPDGDFTPLHRRPWPGAAVSMPTSGAMRSQVQ